MNIYIDESGSINNHMVGNDYFVIALVRVIDNKALKKAYKRFVSSNFNRLKELDRDKVSKDGRILKTGGKMFENGKFKELKGSQFDRDMKLKFIEFFTRKPLFEVFYIKIKNKKLQDRFCSNTARTFNYPLKLALDYFIKNGLLPNEDCILQLDERNERTETKFFLEEYLNTELSMNGTASGNFKVTYFDSANNSLIQIADVFSNLYYSELKTGGYSTQFDEMKENGFIKYEFEFPLG